MTIESLLEVFRAHFRHRGLVLADRKSGRPLDGLAELEAVMELAEVAADAIRPLRWDEEITREIPASVLAAVLAELENE